METPEASLGRLLTALEELTQQEESLFNKGLYRDSIAVQQRSMPVATKIASLLVGPGVAQSLEKSLQVRLQQMLQRRQEHYKIVTTKVTEAEKELKRLSEAEARTRIVRPYGERKNRRPVSAFAAEG